MSGKLNLNISEIGPDGLQLTVVLDDHQVRELLAPAGLALAPGQAMVELSVCLNSANEGVFVLRGCMDGRLWTECGRCLGPAEVAISEPDLKRIYFPTVRQGADADGELELAEDDLDEAVHDGEHIDLASLVRDSLVLAVPIAPLCAPDCAGVAMTEQAVEQDVPAWKEALERIKGEVGRN